MRFDVAIDFDDLDVSCCFGCPARAAGTLHATVDVTPGLEVTDHDFADLADLELWIDYDWSGRHYRTPLGSEPEKFAEVTPGCELEKQILDQPVGVTVSQVYRRWPHDPAMTRRQALRSHLLDHFTEEIQAEGIQEAARANEAARDAYEDGKLQERRDRVAV